ncbi:unnamed protein product [Phaeothamnion confervicola]
MRLWFVMPVWAVLAFLGLTQTCGFLQSSFTRIPRCRRSILFKSLIMAAKKQKAKGAASKKLSVKGFGSKPASAAGTLLRDAETMALAKWLETNGADMRRVAVADFNGLRGVMALQDIPKGDAIIRVPSGAAVYLGDEGPGPEMLAMQLLKLRSDPDSRWSPYFASLPAPGGPDLTTTDFFTEDELDMLQFPPVADETRRRLARCRSLYDDVVLPQVEIGSAFHNAKLSLEDLKWALFVVVSRVLSVLRMDDVTYSKLLIPGIDLFNHRAGAPHILRGRLAPGSTLEIVAGEYVKAGEEITIEYMGGGARSDRMVQDYGFLDPAVDDVGWLRQMPAGAAASAAAQDALRQTSLEEDEALLAAGGLPPRAKLAVEFRMLLKRAVAKTTAGEGG